MASLLPYKFKAGGLKLLAVQRSRAGTRLVGTTIAAAVLTLALNAGAAGSSSTSAAHDAAAQRGLCSTIKTGAKKRAFYKEGMSCRGAKKRARKVIRSNGRRKPKGFTCASEGKRWKKNGVCVSRKRPERNFGWHPR